MDMSFISTIIPKHILCLKGLASFNVWFLSWIIVIDKGKEANQITHSQHYNKLIKSCRKGNTDTPQTPKKSRNAASAKGTPTSGRKRKQVQMANDEGEDDENLPSESPKIKKRKQEVEGDRKLKLESISEAESVELYED